MEVVLQWEQAELQPELKQDDSQPLCQIHLNAQYYCSHCVQQPKQKGFRGNIKFVFTHFKSDKTENVVIART